MFYPVTIRMGGRVRRWLALLAVLALLAPAAAQAQPYGHAIAQPFFDFPSWARFSDCRPGPVPWGYEVFPEYYGSADCGCPPVPSVSCIDEFVAHRPSDWYASADFVPLTIDYSQDLEIARFGPAGPTALSTSNLDPEFDAGGKFTLGRRFADCYRLEATYLGAYEWTDAALVTNDDPNDLLGLGDLSTLLSEFADPLVPGLDANNLVAIENRTQMHNVELNVRYWVDMPPGPFDVSLLVGARYMSIAEQFNFRSEAAVPLPGGAINDAQVNTDNDMWGIQIGVSGDWLIHPRCWINLDLKGAMFDNQASQLTSYTFTDPAGVATNFPTDAAQSRTSWLFDLSLVSHWQMTPNLVFNLGYQATFVEGVAIAYENLQTDNTLLTGGPGVLDDSGRLVYHGPVIGLMWVR